MNEIKQHYIIDLSSNNNFVQVPVVQGDGNDVRYVEIELIENGKQYVIDADDVNILITGTKPDGTQIWNFCTVTNEGYITVEITYQMSAAVGRGIYQITLYEKGKNNQLKSFPFYIYVTASAYDPEYIISTDEFEALAQYTSAAAAAADKCEEIYDDISTIGTIGIMSINPNDGHLYFEQSDAWDGTFSIQNDTNLLVQWE